jgi:hypothetical protein
MPAVNPWFQRPHFQPALPAFGPGRAPYAGERGFMAIDREKNFVPGRFSSDSLDID